MSTTCGFPEPPFFDDFKPSMIFTSATGDKPLQFTSAQFNAAVERAAAEQDERRRLDRLDHEADWNDAHSWLTHFIEMRWDV